MKKIRITIDFGSANMKIFGFVDGREKRVLIKSCATNTVLNGNHVVEYNNEKIAFGIGDSMIKVNKVERPYFIQSVMLAAYELYGDKAENNDFEVELGMGLPISQYKASGEEYEAALKEKYLNKKIVGKVNDVDISIKITFLKIHAEGYSAFYALYDDFDKDTPFMVVDIGYKTTDIIGVGKDSTGQLETQGYGSINRGMREVFNSALKRFYQDTKYNCPLNAFEDAIIENRLLKINADKGIEKVNPRNWLKYGKDDVITLFNTIETDIFPDMRTRNIYLVGGGSVIVHNILQDMAAEDKQKAIESDLLQDMEYSLFANSIGYYMQIEDTL